MPEGFGYYGKIPARGDFLRKGLSPGFIQPWDEWEQQFLLTGRETLSQRWQEAYFSAPIWRFAVKPGLCGPSAAAGVIMPSVDSVGRQFPLTLAIESDLPEAWDVYVSAARCFERLEEAALATLDDNADLDWFEGCLRELALDDAPPTAHVSPFGSGLSMRTRSSVPDALAQEFLAKHASTGSIWVSELAGERHFLSYASMPESGEEIGALLDLETMPWSAQRQFAPTRKA